MAVTALVSYLSLINLAGTPVVKIGVSDKLMHGSAYFGLALLWLFFVLFGYPEKGLTKRMLIICGASIAFGIFIEVLQEKLTTYRGLETGDMIANTVGVLVAFGLVWTSKDYLISLKAKIS